MVVFAVACGAWGCSLLIGDGFTGGEDPEDAAIAAADGAAEDGAADGGASADADVAGGPNVLPTPGFETANASCGPDWGGGGPASLTPDPDAHSGARSCRVCSTGTNGYFSLDPVGQGLADVAPGHVYRGEVWVRAVIGADAPGVRINIRVYPQAGQQQISSSVFVTPTSAWQKLTHRYEIESAGRIEMFVGASPSTGTECFLADDVALVRER